MALIKCPECGEISVYKGNYCNGCFENYDKMNITEKDFVTPLFEKKFVRIDNDGHYKKIIMLTEREGVIVSPKMWGDYEEDYFCEPIVKNGNIIDVLKEDDRDFCQEKYEMIDCYLNPIAKGDIYSGVIPNANYFEVYCATGTGMTLEKWFTSEGDVFLYEPNIKDAKDLHPMRRGRYVRDGDIIRSETIDTNTGEKFKSCDFVIKGRYCPGALVSEDKLEFYKKEITKPISVSNPTVASPVITKKEFFDNYPCLICNARQIWSKQEWEYYAKGEISIYAECKLCHHVAQEIENPQRMKSIAYHGSDPVPGFRLPAGSIRYLDNPCPYCGAYQARYIKWKDKRASIYFWGRLSSKIGTHYICDNCKKTWE